jgi:hypothetical protein
VRNAVFALAAATVLGLSACGDALDSGSIEKDARAGFEAAGVTVDDVSCPSSGKEGDTIECTVTVQGGDEVKLPYKVGKDSVDATDETIKVINDYAASAGGAGGGGGADTTTTP